MPSHAFARAFCHAALAALAVVTLAAASPLAAQDSADKKPLTLEDYAQWSRVTQVALSPDGRWMTFAYEPNEGDATFHVQRLDGDFEPVIAINGTSPEFSSDSRWVAFLTTPPEEKSEGGRVGRGRGAGGERPDPPRRTIHLGDLTLISADDEEAGRHSVENVASFAFSEDGRYLAVEKARPRSGAGNGAAARRGGTGGPGGGNGAKGEDDGPRGVDLLVRELATGATITLGNVTDYEFNETSSHIAYLVDAEGTEGNGVYLLELATGRMSGLDTAPMRFDGLAWSEDGSMLAALRGETPEGMEQRHNVLLAFTGIGSSGVAATEGDGGAFTARGEGITLPDGVSRMVWDPAEDESFPEGFVLSELETPEWSEDGRRLFMGIKAQRKKLDDDELLKADVEVWHWKDEDIQSRQQVNASRARRDTYESAFTLEGQRFARLADDDLESVRFIDHSSFALGESDDAYEMDRDHPENRGDFYRLDLDTGERALVESGLINDMGTSPDGGWFLFLRDEHVMAENLESGTEIDLTAKAGVDFIDRDFDRPVERPAYGVAGWAPDGSVVVLNTEYDVWAVPLGDGAPVNLTNGMGARERIRFRVIELDGDEDGGGGGFFGPPADPEELDLSRPLLLSAYGEWTKKSGYFRTRSGEDPEELIWEDEMIGSGGFRSPGIHKAQDAERIVFTRQTFRRFPDWWVSDTDFDDPERVTDANPQQDEYLWGRRVLIEYTDERGNELQATLALPGGYEEGERYPMLVYFYEKMSQRHHQYSMPTYDDRPHMSTYASNGYLVLLPDIVFDEGRPGTSALDDVTSAARRAIELGYADPDRIGLQGHSWGGYESSFILTQTDMFAAVVTGAPLTNLVSMYLINYKRSGNANQGLIEWGQGRMGVSIWEDMELYHEQSPLHHTPNISTPFMILHGTADGAVDWNQGLEFYNAARRMGKEVILLSYPDEPHHLEKEDNQKDFQIRMKQFFDHHLMDKPAPRWMAEGVDWLDRKRVKPEMK